MPAQSPTNLHEIFSESYFCLYQAAQLRTQHDRAIDTEELTSRG